MEKVDRRGFIRLGAGLAGAGSMAVALDACSSSSKKSSSSSSTASTVASGPKGTAAPGSMGTGSIQLSWIENVEFSGEFIADTRGYYIQQGFSSFNLISGGPNVNQDAAVASGKAMVGISSPEITAGAINNGADLVIIGAQYQRSPFCIMSMASKPINTPQDMIGKKIGVQSTNEAVWAAFLKANKIDASQVHEVPVEFDPTPLTTGTVDGWFSFVTNEPNELKAKGFDTATLQFQDFNLPLVSETFMVLRSTVSSSRAKLKAFLVAEIMGWHDNIADPTAGPHLAVTKYGKTLQLDEHEQTLESMGENQLILTSDSATNGLFTITPDAIAKTIASLELGGTTISADKLFDTSLIDEVYQEHPELKQSPTPGGAAATTTTTAATAGTTSTTA